jgi:NNP family nitrate/nitrite transporter-like MFS transporter
MIPAALFGIALGALADKFGVKRVVGSAVCISMAGCLLRVFAASYGTMLLSMAMIGFSVAAANVNSAKIAGHLYPREMVSRKVGVAYLGGPVSTIIATSTTALLPSSRCAYWIAFGISVIALIVWLAFINDRPSKGKYAADDGKDNDISIWEGIVAAVKNRHVWVLGFCLFFLMGCYLPVIGFFSSALQTKGVSAAEAGLMTSFSGIGGVAGALLGPKIFSLLRKVKPALFFTGLVMGVNGALCWMLPEWAVFAGMLIFGYCFTSLITMFISYPAMIPEVDPKYVGSASGIAATLQLLGAVIVPTYVITPIAGNDYYLLFTLAGMCCAVMCGFIFLLPELNRKGRNPVK